MREKQHSELRHQARSFDDPWVESLQQGFDAFFEFIPNLIAFLVILVVGYFVAKLVKGFVSKALEKLGLDRALHESDAGQYVERVSPDAHPSRMVEMVAFWLIFLFVLTAAIGALQMPAVTAFMNQVLAYLPNVIAAVVIFVVAAAVAGAVGGAVRKLMGETSTGKLIRAAVPSLIMVIAVFMVLNRLKIAEEIVTITYAALLGSVALGMALAFGLGGREVAGRMLEDAQDKARTRRTRPRTTSRRARSEPTPTGSSRRRRSRRSARTTGARTRTYPTPGRGSWSTASDLRRSRSSSRQTVSGVSGPSVAATPRIKRCRAGSRPRTVSGSAARLGGPARTESSCGGR